MVGCSVFGVRILPDGPVIAVGLFIDVVFAVGLTAVVNPGGYVVFTVGLTAAVVNSAVEVVFTVG